MLTYFVVLNFRFFYLSGSNTTSIFSDTDQEDFREATDREPTSYSTTSTSWLRDNSMDADINSYSKGTLLRKDEYFFKIWCYATKLFK